MYCKCGCGKITTKMKRTKGKYNKGDYTRWLITKKGEIGGSNHD